jgi:hypothetical protein
MLIQWIGNRRTSNIGAPSFRLTNFRFAAVLVPSDLSRGSIAVLKERGLSAVHAVDLNCFLQNINLNLAPAGQVLALRLMVVR